MKERIEQFLKAEKDSEKATGNYDRYLSKLEGTKKPEIKINYSEETKAMFKAMKHTGEEKKSTNKPQKDKSIGKASQRRGNGRGCI